MIEVRCQSGLCNRLRVLFSWREYARKRQQQLIMVWPRWIACEERFDKLFNPISGVTFEYKDRATNLNYNGCQVCCVNGKRPVFDYRDLVPLDEILTQVRWRQQWLGDDYVAVHIRRTDFIPHRAKLNKKPTADAAFADFLDKHPGKKIHVATDDFQTYARFKMRYGDKLAPPQTINQPAHVRARTTSIQDAVTDIWVCRGASHFMGSDGSSFSGLIKTLRREDDN